MEDVLKVGDISIKATPAKDKKGRKGYFITNAEIRKKTRIVVVKQPKKSKKATSSISPDVLELLDEMNAHIQGKIKPRPLDEFLTTV
jgi:hypothetical protein